MQEIDIVIEIREMRAATERIERQALRHSVLTCRLFVVTWSLVVVIFLLFYVTTSVNFKKLHNFGSDRISVLEQVTSRINVCDTLP